MILIGYAIVPFVYDRASGRISLGPHSLFAIAGLLTLFFIIFDLMPSLFLGGYENLSSEAAIVEVANYRFGGSTYLTGQVVNNLGDLILYGPVRALYFLGSPMPWDIRNLSDLAAFGLDASFYLATFFSATFAYRRAGTNKSVLAFMLLTILLTVLVFGAGVTNSGTALRHRYKLFSLFLVLMAATGKSMRFATKRPGSTLGRR